MAKTGKAKYGVADAENPEWDRATFAQSKRRDELPKELQQMLPRRRGPSKKPSKVALTLRLSRQVVDAFRATGDGWQTRMNETLERAAKRL